MRSLLVLTLYHKITVSQYIVRNFISDVSFKTQLKYPVLVLFYRVLYQGKYFQT